MRVKVNMCVKKIICKAGWKLSAEDNSYADQWISDETWLWMIRKRCPRHGPLRGPRHGPRHGPCHNFEQNTNIYIVP